MPLCARSLLEVPRHRGAESRVLTVTIEGDLDGVSADLVEEETVHRGGPRMNIEVAEKPVSINRFDPIPVGDCGKGGVVDYRVLEVPVGVGVIVHALISPFYTAFEARKPLEDRRDPSFESGVLAHRIRGVSTAGYLRVFSRP